MNESLPSLLISALPTDARRPTGAAAFLLSMEEGLAVAVMSEPRSPGGSGRFPLARYVSDSPALFILFELAPARRGRSLCLSIKMSAY